MRPLQIVFYLSLMALRADRRFFFDRPIRGVYQTAAQTARPDVRVASDMARATGYLPVETDEEKRISSATPL